jgi:hypothetical protein
MSYTSLSHFQSKTFATLKELESELPEVADLIVSENNMQYPDVKYVNGCIGVAGQRNDLRLDVMCLFSSEKYPDQYLWCWIPGTGDGSPYLDEYYWLPKEEGVEYLNTLLEGV